VNGYFGFISVRPSGYCDLTLSEVAPNGRGRDIELVDMRVKRRLETDDRKTLVVYRRRAVVGWFEHLPAAIEFLGHCTERQVDVLHR
jgi:hypothetical protein